MLKYCLSRGVSSLDFAITYKIKHYLEIYLCVGIFALMKRVLIITYYWPPTGGSGVQRWVKFCKYLPSMGWQPVVYTPENPEQLAVDTSLLKDIPEEVEVLKTPIREP